MVRIHHINCGFLHAPPNPKAICHCLLLEGDKALALVDAGIGIQDVHDPRQRIGQALIDLAGFQFNERDTAVRQIESLGFAREDVVDVVLTHCDPDHTGGLADFPRARVHVAAEELASVNRGHFRYLPAHFAHGPVWRPCDASTKEWFGVEARRVELGFEAEVYLVPLFGHTLGHCGVAVRQGDTWFLHAGDAYYLRVELERDDHPVSQLAAARADDDAQRRINIERLRRLAQSQQINMCGYHDVLEFPHPLPG